MAAVLGRGIKTHNINPIVVKGQVTRLEVKGQVNGLEVTGSVHCNMARALCLSCHANQKPVAYSARLRRGASVTLPCKKHCHSLVEYDANSALECACVFNVPDVVIQMAEHYGNQYLYHIDTIIILQ